MSSLLNNNNPKKKLLNRGPKIVPDLEFKLEDKVVEPPSVEQPATEVKEPTVATVANPPKRVNKKRDATSITSVRVTKATRNKLNALIQIGKADNVDTLIDIILDEYIETTLVKDEKKSYNLVLNILQKRER